MDTVIEVKELVRDYGTIEVLKGLDFSAHEGEFIKISWAAPAAAKVPF